MLAIDRMKIVAAFDLFISILAHVKHFIAIDANLFENSNYSNLFIVKSAIFHMPEMYTFSVRKCQWMFQIFGFH